MLFTGLSPADTVKKKVDASNLRKTILKPTSFSYWLAQSHTYGNECKTSTFKNNVWPHVNHDLKTSCKVFSIYLTDSYWFHGAYNAGMLQVLVFPIG